jgi:AcrR family transcriptional regulator
MTATRHQRRPPGRDATRNDALVLQAAREVLAESGPQASMEQIATRAGVGVGSIYRRFPSKDALIDELVRLVMEDLDTAAEAALADDDGGGLERFLHGLGRSFVEHRRYAALMLARGGDETGTRRVRRQIAQLTDNARGAGTLNPEVTLGDVMALIWSLRALAETTGDVAPGAWKRHLDIHLDGMRGTHGSHWSKPITDRQLAKLAPREGGHVTTATGSSHGDDNG